MTGDLNQKNKFGFERLFPNPAMNLPRFNDSAPASVPLLGNTPENPTQCLFATSSSPSFPSPNPLPSTSGNMPFFSSYLLPSSSSVNVPLPINNPFCPSSVIPQAPESTLSFPESSSGIPPSFTSNSQQSFNPFAVKPIQWDENAKPNYNFSSSPFAFTSKVSPFAFGCKRKTDSPPLPPLKQHITEEKMAEHMSRLHISSQTPTVADESPPLRQRRLYMCKEMQRLQVESIIPAQILDKINQPCTALVPWQPPIVPLIPTENNNNEEESDSNIEQRDPSNVMDMES